MSLIREPAGPTLATKPVSAHDVTAVLRERQPGVATKKLHKLLCYCQGHHLAAFGEPQARSRAAMDRCSPTAALTSAG